MALLAEADSFVSLDLSDALQAAGYRVLGPFATTRETLAALSQNSPTLAIIDITLRDGSSATLAEELRRRSVPFLVHSACRQDTSHPVSFQGAPWLIKPALARDVVALCDELFLGGSNAARADGERASSLPVVEQAGSVSNPFVRKLEGFAALSEADRVVLEQVSANARIVPPQTSLVHEGDRPDGVLLVMEGFAGRLKHRANGHRQIMAYLVPGDMGDLDVALLSRMDHTITTLSACKVVRIAPETVAALVQHHSQIARALRMATLVDEATLREWLMNVGCRSAVERIAHLFCELLVRLGAVGLAQGNSYDLPITQLDIADTTGLSNVHVNRSLQELRRQGLIELGGRRLTILNLPRLRTLAEFKANYLHLGDRSAA
ncbi:helix-turn-helix domain-containing protein [Methylobacterium iners]|uniref:helix-turn-helix domain-containing protein n=1 Tax=Methylobacterium iners TaxID=418707 RepID=UPI0027958CC9|nr:helix-turn-helix domain-containing protein [Methylobacterium iners]